ncbi:putative pectinesterase/pectinesterase inhibitor 24 [Phtheirospermum japonicum]|uniref:Pectinesterase n=1 Tax=Phtheirospermum japonicum TaxID=374723 RepID=A0A830BYE6_9LAMI|nr:putative pectinesterase/pectinesterase inhibitor 24 [Phtheirospermum japonicum]
MATLNPYGKLDEAEQERLIALRKARRRITIIALSSIVLIAIVIATVVGVTQTNKNNNKSETRTNSASSTIKAICNTTLYPDSCYTTLSPLLKSGNVNPQDLFKLSVQVAIDELATASKNFAENGAKQLNITDQPTLAAIASCQELFSLALDHLNNSLSIKDVKLLEAFDDLMTWLSSAGTYQQTCIDDLEGASSGISRFANDNFKNSNEYTSNSLAILSSFGESIDALGAIGRRRRLMSLDGPGWVTSKDRRLLQSPSSKIKADAVVAKDGSGKYKTIKAALAAVPEKSKKRFVIYVKKGVYYENVRVEKKLWNVMMVGDGKGATVVSGSLNVVDGTPTFQSATFAVFGQGFIARDMGFRNTAGAAKHQAVALMSTADLSIFYRCTMDAFQDTLYPHSNRQFYRECDIYGTVDFIFGNSAVVIQNCNILPKKPMLGQQITITAQGKIDPNQNTGISIQNCTILPAANLTGVNTFLGRPWKNYSTTVMFHNVMGSFIDPKGWLPWVGNSAPNTIFYAEFQNLGPGAVTKKRVNWKGLKLNLSATQVKKFTVGPFLHGDKWIPETGVTYKSGL